MQDGEQCHADRCQKVILLNLHTFDLSPGILSFPALRRVGARLDILTVTEASLAILDNGLADIYPHLTHVGYWGPTGVISDVLDRFPNMQDLVFSVIPLEIVFSHRYAYLSSICLMGEPFFPSFTPKFLSTIAMAALDSLFPSLCKVQLWEHYETAINTLHTSIFTHLGVALEFTYGSQNRFFKFVPFTQAFSLC